MTDKPTPTDAELKAMWQLHAADIGGIFHYARAVLAKWGTPATGGEPAGTVGYTVHGTQYVNWRTKPPAHGTPLYTTQQPTQAQAGAVPLTNEHIRAMLNKHPPEDVCDWSYRMGIDDAELHHGIKGVQHGTESST